MRKKIIEQGKRTILPLDGDEVWEIRLGVMCLATLIFRDSTGGKSQIVFEEAITLVRGDYELFLTGSRPGSTFDPQSLHPLLALLGNRVTDAWAERNGQLELAFSNDWVLRVAAETKYEAWHYRYPVPAQPAGGDLRDDISLDGANGRLIQWDKSRDS